MGRLNPLDYPASLACPRGTGSVAGLEHIPFALAVMALVRPHVIAVIGSNPNPWQDMFGQAAVHLELPAWIQAVDISGNDRPNKTLQAASDDEQRAGAGAHRTIVTASPETASAHFPDASVDLLHLDVPAHIRTMRDLWQLWLPKLSPRAVVLLVHWHRTAGREIDPFWKEVRKFYPSFEFHHDGGLGIWAVGPERPTALQPLLEASEEERSRIQGFYGQLGQRLSACRERDAALARLSEQRAKRIALEQRLADAEQMLRVLEAQLTEKEEILQTMQAHHAAAQHQSDVREQHLRATLLAMTGSRSWRMAQRVSSVVRGVVPPGSRRRQLVEWTLRPRWLTTGHWRTLRFRVHRFLRSERGPVRRSRSEPFSVLSTSIRCLDRNDLTPVPPSRLPSLVGKPNDGPTSGWPSQS